MNMSIISTYSEFEYLLSRNLIDWVWGSSFIRSIVEAGAQNATVKGMVPAIIFWYLWFHDSYQPVKRSQLIATLLTSVFAIVAGRVLANILPFRSRPLGTVEVMGENVRRSDFLNNWSSMPSDHAVMFFTLAGCIFLISRREGILSFLHATFVVCAARVLVGAHYLSDIVVGAIVGTAIAVIVMPVLARHIQKQRDKHRWSLRPEIGYPLLFLVTFQFATMFDGARNIVGILVDFLV